jgi:uncharacterized membrane protein
MKTSPAARHLPCLLALVATLGLAPLPDAGAQEPATRARDLADVFGPDGSIAVPYDELLRLIRGEQRPTPTPTETTAPSGFVLVGATVKASARQSVVELEATVDLDLVGAEGWVVVPLRLKQAALKSATLDGKPAVISPLSDLVDLPKGRAGKPRNYGYGVLIRGKGRKTLVVTGELPLRRGAGTANLSLDLPAAALTKFVLDVPSSDASLSGELTREEAKRADGRATITAFYGARQTAAAGWSVRAARTSAEPTAARKPLVIAETHSAVRLEEGVLLTTVQLDVRVLQAPTSRLRVKIPTGATLLEVKGLDLGRYPEPKRTKGGQLVNLDLRRPLLGSAQLVLQLEQNLPEDADVVPVPRVATVGTQRERGSVAVRAARYLTLEPRNVKRLAKVQPRLFPSALLSHLGWKLGAPRPPLVFQHRGGPWELEVATRAVQAEVEGKLHSLAVVREEEVALATTAVITVRKRPVFGLRFALPKGFTFLHFGNQRQVRDHRIEGDVLVVALREPIKADKTIALGIFGLVRREAAEGEGAQAKVVVERLRLLDAGKESGQLAVGSKLHLQLAPEGRPRGLWPLDLRELVAAGFPHGAGQGEELLYAFRHTQAESSGTFTVTKREPRLRAQLQTMVDAQEDQVRVKTKAACEVEFAGLTSVRLRGPAVLKDLLAFDQEGIANTSVALEGEDHAIWTISLQGKRTGSFTLGWHYTVKLDDFSAGQQKAVSLASLEILDAFRHGEEVALKKHENLVATDIARELVETRDPRELSVGLRGNGVIRGYRVQDWPFRLTFQLTKYDFRAPLGIEIRHVHTDEVVNERGTVSAEAVLEIQNRNQQDLQVLLPPGARMISLMLAKRASEWRAGPAREGRPLVLVHLGQVTKQRTPFKVLLRYEYPLPLPSALGEIAPTGLGFPLAKATAGVSEVPVARSTRTLFLPKDYAYLSFGGGTKHFEEEGVWRTLTGFLRDLRGQPRRISVARKAASQTQDAIARLRGVRSQASIYTPLDLPSRRTHRQYLFERLGAQVTPRVRVMAWSVFFLLDLLVLVLVVACGLVLARKEAPGAPWAFPLTVLALSLVGGAVGGRALQPFFAAAFLGASGLLMVFLIQAMWRELTVRRSERQEERGEREAQVARERAAAMEAEAALREAEDAPEESSAEDEADEGGDA